MEAHDPALSPGRLTLEERVVARRRVGRVLQQRREVVIEDVGRVVVGVDLPVGAGGPGAEGVGGVPVREAVCRLRALLDLPAPRPLHSVRRDENPRAAQGVVARVRVSWTNSKTNPTMSPHAGG